MGAKEAHVSYGVFKKSLTRVLAPTSPTKHYPLRNRVELPILFYPFVGSGQ
jgi:hypothetical protein